MLQIKVKDHLSCVQTKLMRKISLMFAVYSLIFFTCSLIFFAIAPALHEQGLKREKHSELFINFNKN